MADLIRVLRNCESCDPESDPHLREEWLVTNGLGGYASGTISGVVTWRYHGLLIAALPAPLGRVVMLNHLSECLWLPDGRRLQIGGEEIAQSEGLLTCGQFITEFRLENQMPIWHCEAEGIILEDTKDGKTTWRKKL